MREADLPEGTPRCAVAGETPILLVRHQGQVKALHNRCSHRGGPLDEGEIENGCVTCPWHGSVFRLSDGAVERGPATGPQPPFDVRERDGRLEVRRRA
jgi:nitrite reductase/ring-hydroxylating ferredoxin subunit